MKNIEEYTVKITLLSPARVGEGAEGNRLSCMTRLIARYMELTEGKSYANVATLHVSKMRLERLPLIPGSSLKGLLRAITERIAPMLYSSVNAKDIEDIPRLLAALHHQPRRSELEERREKLLLLSSVLHAQPGDLEEQLNGKLVQKKIAELAVNYELRLPDAPDDAPRDWSYEAFASRYCPICLLYGSQHQAGAIRILDAIPVRDVRLTTLSHVSIDRRTRTKAEGKLFQEEVIPAGTTFIARLYIAWPLPSVEEESSPYSDLYNAALEEARKLWQKTLEYIRIGGPASIGSGKSRGLGKALITIT